MPVGDEHFLILTAPIAQTFMDRKASDLERWLRGMRRQAPQDPSPGRIRGESPWLEVKENKYRGR